MLSRYIKQCELVKKDKQTYEVSYLKCQEQKTSGFRGETLFMSTILGVVLGMAIAGAIK